MSMTNSEATAWHVGVRSGVLRPLHDNCPYPMPSPEAAAWFSGRVEGQAHADGCEVSREVHEVAMAVKTSAAEVEQLLKRSER